MRLRRDRATERLARGLGWFSIGLGGAELLAPRHVGACVGLEDRPGLLRFYGVRELAAGIGLLATEKRATFLWMRVLGDVVDLATLAYALVKRPDARTGAAVATGMVAGITALDVIGAQRASG
jgi:hypothetical protein